MNWNISLVKKTLSTNIDATEAAQNGAPEGTIIWAEEQSEGRGRQGRTWSSVPGESLCFSIILRPNVPPNQAVTLPLVAGIAVAQAVEPLLHHEISIKWPNDLLVHKKKMCGILCEMLSSQNIQTIILGIGLNVNLNIATLPPDVQSRATSMSELTNTTFSLPTVLGDILTSFEPLYQTWLTDGFAAILPLLQKRDALLGHPVSIALTSPPLCGVAVGIQSDGALLIQEPSGLITPVYSGEAHIEGFYSHS